MIEIIPAERIYHPTCIVSYAFQFGFCIPSHLTFGALNPLLLAYALDYVE